MSRFTLTPTVVAAIALASSLAAQLRWEPVATPVAPPARFGHAANQWGLMFGGRDGQQLFQDTWLSLGGPWQQLTLAIAPPGRVGHTLTGTIVTVGPGQNEQIAILFGGEDLTGTKLGDTWRFRRWLTFVGPWGQPTWNAQWQLMNPATAPSPRSGHAMSHDHMTDNVLLFGGETAQGLSDETWLFSAGNWQLLPSQIRPPARRGHVLVADGVVGYRMIGGNNGTGPLNDSWTFDGSQWQRETDPGFGAPHLAGEYSWRRDSLLVVASDIAGGSVLTTLRERTSDGTWLPQQQAGVPLARTAAVLIPGYDLLAFGGRDAAGNALGDTLRLEPVHPAATESFGVGCGPGPCNAGPLLYAPELRLGRSIRCHLLTGDPGNFAALVMQLGKAMASDRCELSVMPQFVHADFVDAWGGISMLLAAPHDPALRGLQLSIQGIALPLGGSGPRLAVSEGLLITIGD